MNGQNRRIVLDKKSAVSLQPIALLSMNGYRSVEDFNILQVRGMKGSIY
ncbi:MAG: hypothetical protein ACJARF_001342 [Alteromonadaceae bacterium]|jgi:hypothetical protein